MKCCHINNILSFIFLTFFSVFIYASFIYSIQNEYPSIYNKVEQIIVITFSIPFFICFYWSFLKCATSGPGYVDGSWEINAEENNIEIIKSKIRNYTPNKFTVCDKCNYLVRPERSHHCRACKKCVLKMDHHCVWIGTCVGEKNLKFFFLFIFYSLLIILYIVVTILPKFITQLTDGTLSQIPPDFRGITTIIACAAITLFVTLIYLNCQYIYFISRNITVIESSYSENNPYDLDTYNNWKMVFGTFNWKWFFPVEPDKSYITYSLYPLNDKYLNKNDIDMGESSN